MQDETGASARQGMWHGVEAVFLAEPASGSEIVVLPGLGCNVVSFRTRVGGRLLDILASPPSAERLAGHSTGYGIPILFPYPGPVHGGRFRFEGREISLPTNDGKGNAIHGFASRLAWRRVKSSGSHAGSATFRVDTASAPEILSEWPFDYRLEMTIRLLAGQLTLAFEVENTGSTSMPMGLGLHAYFATPLAGLGDRANHLLSISADRVWEHPDTLSTCGTQVTRETRDIRQSRQLRSIHTRPATNGLTSQYEVYSAFEQTRGLNWEAAGGASCTLDNTDQKLRVGMETSAAFNVLVLYRPPENTSVALEPRTCVPDAFNLASRGIDRGMVVLQPGDLWHGWVRISASEIASTA